MKASSAGSGPLKHSRTWYGHRTNSIIAVSMMELIIYAQFGNASKQSILTVYCFKVLETLKLQGSAQRNEILTRSRRFEFLYLLCNSTPKYVVLLMNKSSRVPPGPSLSQ